MTSLLPILKIVLVLLAAGILGNMFLTEARKARVARKPWYAPYFTLPGFMVVLIVILAPVLLWLKS